MAANSKNVTKSASKAKAVAKNVVKDTKKAPVKKAAPAKKAVKAAPIKVAQSKGVAVKTAAKKAVVSKPQTSKAPVKKAVAKKTTPVKSAPVKKTAVKVAATKIAAKKVAVKKAAPAKMVPAKKVAAIATKAPAKKTAIKLAPVKKSAAKKASAPKKVLPSPPAKKTVVAKAVDIVKKTKVGKEEETPKVAPKKIASAPAKTATPVASKKARSKKDRDEVPPAPLSAREEIADAFVQKTNKKSQSKGEVVAFRALNDSRKKREDETMEEFKPKRKSILDNPESKSISKKRYSDDELNEFKELILNRMEKAKKELVYLQGLITRKDDAGTADTDNKFNHMEDGSGAMEREQIAQLAGRQIQFINHLEKALMRIENKTYGVCRVTGELIDKARLRAVPHATLSIEAKRAQRK